MKNYERGDVKRAITIIIARCLCGETVKSYALDLLEKVGWSPDNGTFFFWGNFQELQGWLDEEYKEQIKLTRFDMQLLTRVSDGLGYKYINRSGDGMLELIRQHPNERAVYSGCLIATGLFDTEFEFVGSDEPCEIKWLLDNAEVVDDE